MRNHHFEHVPAELKSQDQWVTWTYLNGQKVPFAARTGRAASSTNPETWDSFVAACQGAEQRKHAGIGYATKDSYGAAPPYNPP